MKTQHRPIEIDSRLCQFSVEVSCLLTGRYRLISQSTASHIVFEGDFWGETASEFSHSLGQNRSLELASIGSIIIAFCLDKYRMGDRFMPNRGAWVKA